MEALKSILFINALFIGNALIANGLAWLCTEYRGPVFKFKPFNCRACLAFWWAVLIGIVLAFVLVPKFPQYSFWDFAQLGVLYGFINHFYTKSKFKVYE